MEKEPTVKEKKYMVTETVVANILGFLAKLPWQTANDIINYVRQSIVEIPEEIPEKDLETK